MDEIVIYVDGIIIIYVAIVFLVKKLKKLRSHLHFYGESRSEYKFGIRYVANYNEGVTDSFHEIHPPKSIPITESHTAPLNAPENTSNNPASESAALHHYKNGAISLGKAGELLGLSKQEMLHLLSIKDTPINYDVGDLESDPETLDRVL